VAQPYPAGEDRDREHEGQQVQEPHQVVANAEHCPSPVEKLKKKKKKRRGVSDNLQSVICIIIMYRRVDI
jgi:hypothetical protein